MHRPRVAFLCSGAGTTFEAVAIASRSGRLWADVVLLVAGRAGIEAIARARRLGIEHALLDEKPLGTEACDRELRAALESVGIDLVVLAGFLRKLGPQTLAAFNGRILNTHPAPLPRFGGPGMYGKHVHRAVLDAGVTESAATIHWADSEYDTGPVLATRPVPVLAGDDVAALQQRVQAVERELLIDTIDTLSKRDV